ncbi:MAG: NtaA/DmoA family FMN-dependent monooxygenase [Rhodobiaceae bacterium]|nr:NtaA/DmoA family FMN-dependent monooxygenase [Rhodobiaceae bacterium]
MQFPGNDPSVLVSALALATKHLGFVVTSSILQAHPFEFARRMSTLDHLTKGRVGWNIVTSYLETAASNMGIQTLPEHDLRYDMAEDYLEVAYKLWEASWGDDAVVADVAANMLFNPALVRPIDHEGPYYRSSGPHMSQPSPQRTPVLYQAGGSPRGKRFAGKHAEVSFLGAMTPEMASQEVADLAARAADAGRAASDLLSLVLISPIIGSTEEEAWRKQRELREWADYDAIMCFLAVYKPVLSELDPDKTLEQILPEAASRLDAEWLGLLSGVPDKSIRYRDFVIDSFLPAGRHAGTPEQIADIVQSWAETGASGFNVVPVQTLGWVDEWVEHVVPVLQKRGLLQTEYSEGSLRHKLFDSGPRLPETHMARNMKIPAASSDLMGSAS